MKLIKCLSLISCIFMLSINIHTMNITKINNDDAVTEEILRLLFKGEGKSSIFMEWDGNEIHLSKAISSFEPNTSINIKIYFGSDCVFPKELENITTSPPDYDASYLKKLILFNISDKNPENYGFCKRGYYSKQGLYPKICSNEKETLIKEKSIGIDKYTSCSNILTGSGYADKHSRGGAILNCVTKIPNELWEKYAKKYSKL